MKWSISCISLCLLLEACNGAFDKGQQIKYSLAVLLLQLQSKPGDLDYGKLVNAITEIHDSIEGRKGLSFMKDSVASAQKRLKYMSNGCNKDMLRKALEVIQQTCADGTEEYKTIYNEYIVNQIMLAYGVKEIKDVAGTIKNYIISVRKGVLYEQIARFIGRGHIKVATRTMK